LGHIAALTGDAHASLSAGYGTLGYEPKVNYFFGFPTSIEAGGVVLDIPWSMVSHVSDGDMEKRKQYNLQWGMISSALEHAVPEQMFQSQDSTDQQPEAISAVKALQMAGAEGQRIYQITQANMDTALPNIHHDGVGEIQAALQAGMTVITHTDNVSVPGWSGGGYIILVPEDLTGAFKISGGQNGGLAIIGALLMLLGTLMIINSMLMLMNPVTAPLALKMVTNGTLVLAMGIAVLALVSAINEKDSSACNVSLNFIYATGSSVPAVFWGVDPIFAGVYILVLSYLTANTNATAAEYWCTF
jgi:type IV secretory pathway VirB3-like protein